MAHQARPHPVQRLQIELLDRLRGHKAHPRALNRLGDRLGVAVIVLQPLEKRLHVARRHQPGVVAERQQLAAQVAES